MVLDHLTVHFCSTKIIIYFRKGRKDISIDIVIGPLEHDGVNTMRVVVDYHLKM